jgi:putative RNA 2'-phosphotransferase
MTTKKLTTISKFLSFVLRHDPGHAKLVLDAAGWTPIEDLLARCTAAGHPITRAELEEVVATNDKKRFAISDDGLRIRASQGHSVAVDLELPVVAPPEVLYHGTATRFRAAIEREGLRRGTRHHVHLTGELATARAVGARYGVPVILRVDAQAMVRAGFEFRCSDNGVWLVGSVPPQFLEALP